MTCKFQPSTLYTGPHLQPGVGAVHLARLVVHHHIDAVHLKVGVTQNSVQDGP